MDKERRIRLSKLMSYVLRHNPWKFGLKPDEYGFVSIKDLIRAISRIYSWITEENVKEVIAEDEKGRFEIRRSKIRARYGHSYEVRINHEEDRSSKILYHGTAVRNLKRILQEGIKPMGRQFVHLSIDKENAIETAKRHDKNIVIFEIDAECLREKGYKIYVAGKFVRIAKYVPPDCIVKREMII